MNAVNPYNDKRKYQRLKINIAATFELDKPLRISGWFRNKEFEGVILDLSEDGVAILTKHYIPTDTLLSIEFMLYKVCRADNFKLYKTIKAKGEVKSNVLLKGNQYRIGICFKQISDEDKYEIVNFVKRGVSSRRQRFL